MLNSMRCGKCGLIQLATPTCQKCGKASGVSDDQLSIRRSADGYTAAAPPRSTEPAPPTTARPAIRPAPPSVPEPAAFDSMAEPTVVQHGADFDSEAQRTELTGEPTEIAAEPVAAQADDQDTERRLTFAGSAGTLFGIHIVNTLLTLLTLGLYYPWAKVKVRSYLMSQSKFEGDRFAYHGTGRELLFGFLKGGLVFGAISFLFSAAPMLPGGPPAMFGAIAAAYLALLLLIPVAMVGARRYRLSRTSWRNVRFSFQGSTGEFIKLFVGGTLLTVLTLGLYYPFFATNRHGFMVANSRFGDRTFSFDGRGRDLFGPYLIALLLTVPTLGFVWLWFWARRTRYYWEHTTFDAARFVSTITGRRLFGLHFVNALLLMVTFGLAWPLVTVRNIRFQFDNLTMVGPLDTSAVKQNAQDATATGDGLSSFLEVDTGFAA